MRRSLIVIALLLWPLAALGQGGINDSLKVLGHRFPIDLEWIEIKMAYSEVGNQVPGETMQSLQTQVERITSLNDEIPQTAFLWDGDFQYPDNRYDENNPYRVWWSTAMGCSLANVAIHAEAFTYGRRTKGFAMRMGLGASGCDNGPDYCWWDCNQSHGNCGTGNDFDVFGSPTHEFMHCMTGAGHYYLCARNESIMWERWEYDCYVHRTLGTVDEWFTAYITEGVFEDQREPWNDDIRDAYFMGSLGQWGWMSDSGNQLRGHAEIDFFKFDTSLLNSDWTVEVEVTPQDADTDVAFTVFLGFSEQYTVDSHGSGQSESRDFAVTDWQPNQFVGVYTSP